MEATAISAIVATVTALLTILVNKYFDKEQRKEKQENHLVDDLIERVKLLETSSKELRQELKNRDEEYVSLYKEHATLRAKYDVLFIDNENIKKEHIILKEKVSSFEIRNEKIDSVHKNVIDNVKVV